jgi:hypothetical protein
MHHWFGSIPCFYLQVTTWKTKDVRPEEAAAFCYVSMDTASCAAKLDSTAEPGSPLKTDTASPSTHSAHIPAHRAQSSERVPLKLITELLKLTVDFTRGVLSPAVTAVICCYVLSVNVLYQLQKLFAHAFGQYLPATSNDASLQSSAAKWMHSSGLLHSGQ